MADLEKRVALLEKQVARLIRGPKPRPVTDKQPAAKPAAKPKK